MRHKEELKQERLSLPSDTAGIIPTTPLTPAPRRSVLDLLGSTFGGKGVESSLVYGAPSVDRIGHATADVKIPAGKRLA